MSGLPPEVVASMLWASRGDWERPGPFALLAASDDGEPALALVCASATGAALVEIDPRKATGLRDALTSWLDALEADERQQ